jgi:hypothetical protein
MFQAEDLRLEWDFGESAIIFQSIVEDIYDIRTWPHPLNKK